MNLMLSRINALREGPREPSCKTREPAPSPSLGRNPPLVRRPKASENGRPMARPNGGTRVALQTSDDAPAYPTAGVSGLSPKRQFPERACPERRPLGAYLRKDGMPETYAAIRNAGDCKLPECPRDSYAPPGAAETDPSRLAHRRLGQGGEW